MTNYPIVNYVGGIDGTRERCYLVARSGDECYLYRLHPTEGDKEFRQRFGFNVLAHESLVIQKEEVNADK